MKSSYGFWENVIGAFPLIFLYLQVFAISVAFYQSLFGSLVGSIIGSVLAGGLFIILALYYSMGRKRTQEREEKSQRLEERIRSLEEEFSFLRIGKEEP